jgi:hypothetical protein
MLRRPEGPELLNGWVEMTIVLHETARSIGQPVHIVVQDARATSLR